MDANHSAQSSVQSAGQSRPLRDILSGAIRYWEPRRVIYNLVLVAVVMAWLFLTWPHFRSAVALQSLLFLVVLAMLANVCYCAAYVADIPMQYSMFQGLWRRRRWGLWVAGTLFAILLANYWIADEIYPYVR
ncbi:MAG TPA: hypothetical protein VN822_01495 [Candidatus Acidoferrales bacterium]|nr:hypothetical protein [Candidatus Acidoferrales bacterium]